MPEHKNRQYCGVLSPNGKVHVLKYTNTPKGKRPPLYATWCGMRYRCSNKNNNGYKHYGGRGITVYKDWADDYEIWYEYVSQLEHFGEKGRTLDRIDNDKGYFPGNVRWATYKEQANNTRRSKKK